MRRVSAMCIVLAAMIVYHDRLHRTMSAIQKQQQSLMSEDDEIKAMILADDLQLSDKVPCGKEKCFFASKLDSTVGYLVARGSYNDFADTSKLERLQQGWKLAKTLEKKHKIQHFLMDGPKTIPVSDHLASLMNQNLWFETRDKALDEVVKKRLRTRYPTQSQAFVQKVKVAPTPNLLMACAESNRPHFERHVDAFLFGVSPKFLKTFRKNLDKTRKLLKKEPCMVRDFQVLVDKNGVFYHLDFDRCFNSREEDETQMCLDYLATVEERIQVKLRDPFQPNNIKTPEHALCGTNRCFYQTKSSNEVGYMVVRSQEQGIDDSDNTSTTTHGFAALQAGWNLAQNLTQEYGIKHFLLSAPGNVAVSKDLAGALNDDRFPEKSSVFVQKILATPTPNLYIGIDESKMESLGGKVDKFMSFVKDKNTFVSRFGESMAHLKILLHHEPCLARDFEALVDVSGSVYHSLNLDRCFEGEGKIKVKAKELNQCLQALDEIERQVDEAVGK